MANDLASAEWQKEWYVCQKATIYVPGSPYRQVVEEASACIPGLDRIGLYTDHFKINKFRSPEDRSFLQVSAEIHKMHLAAKGVVRRRQDRAFFHSSAPCPR